VCVCVRVSFFGGLLCAGGSLFVFLGRAA
jgi:hypothetical protein